jgi:hypothetical protein
VTKTAHELLTEALRLEAPDRAKLAAELLASLDEQQEDVAAAWAAEIARRAEDARSEPDDEEDWRSALDEIQREVLSQ